MTEFTLSTTTPRPHSGKTRELKGELQKTQFCLKKNTYRNLVTQKMIKLDKKCKNFKTKTVMVNAGFTPTAIRTTEVSNFTWESKCKFNA